jgi:hypothetical protein
MAARKVFVGFAVGLGVGMTASVATALSPCGYRACSEEVAASGLSGQARGACVKQVIADCRAGLCSCTGGSPPCSCVCGDRLCGPDEDCMTCPQDCGACPTTTTTTTTTVTTTLPACGSNGTSCTGACDPGMRCVFLQDAPPFCGCIPAACGDDTFPLCEDGECPPGQQCGSPAFGGGQCACFPVGVTPCGSAQYPTCAGACPNPGEQCAPFTTGSSGNIQGCGCVASGTSCATSCPGNGVCVPGEVCQAFPPCGCVMP